MNKVCYSSIHTGPRVAHTFALTLGDILTKRGLLRWPKVCAREEQRFDQGEVTAFVGGISQELEMNLC